MTTPESLRARIAIAKAVIDAPDESLAFDAGEIFQETCTPEAVIELCEEYLELRTCFELECTENKALRRLHAKQNEELIAAKAEIERLKHIQENTYRGNDGDACKHAGYCEYGCQE